MNHAQTIGLLERTHASVKTHLKAATGEFLNNWHKYLPLAVRNHNTTYHASLGCEPSRVFHGRIPHIILDYKLGCNPNPRYQSHTDIAAEIQKGMKNLFIQTNKQRRKSCNITSSTKPTTIETKSSSAWNNGLLLCS